ncbi:unnamed protein product [Parnassius mnemosyne]|uniref:F-box domain-containing protein n=1 Tax=Parnassius mnemosyne TaxID=213953 RepID=A0AAV1L472_9NEOP
MSVGWGSLPLLPLRCVLEHLSTEDALAATSVCRHWRTALLMYEGRKETLKLRVKQLDKSMFLTRLFRKYTRRLHIYIDCSEAELEDFINYVLPQFFDTQKLIEVIFIGPSYIKQNHHAPLVKLKRKITESLLFKHLHCIQRLAFMGCEMSTAKNVENEKYTHKHFDYYSRPLSFSSVAHPADTVLSRCNVGLMVFSTLQHISVDYDHISTEALETLSHLTLFKNLTLNIARRRKLLLEPIDWHRLNAFYPNGLDVSVNIIALPAQKLKDVMDKVLVDGLTLTSLKVMFCKTFYAPLLRHIVSLYKSTLRELVWVDCPDDSSDTHNRVIKTSHDDEYDVCNVNPLILICWLCAQLQRLVIHGYWVWQYDVVGFLRLRKSLRRLEVSAVAGAGGRRGARLQRGAAPRVLPADVPPPLDASFVQHVNEHTDFKWKPCPWSKLHPGLRARSTPEQRADYVLHEARQTLGVT